MDELRNIESNQPLIRSLNKDEGLIQHEEHVVTQYGTMVVAVHGGKHKPAIITYHDIGLNYVSNFQTFFNFADTKVCLENFTIYHVNAPGQEEAAKTLSEYLPYPSLDELAEMLLSVLQFFGLKHFIGFGVGAGANILSRFALRYPNCVDGLFLINPTCTVAGWAEWLYQKFNMMHLRSTGMTSGIQDYLIWHHFGNALEERSHDLNAVFRNYFNSSVNPVNLSMFIDSYVRRTDLGIVRETDPGKKKYAKNIKADVLLLVGEESPHVDDSIIMNSRLDPTNSTWIKLGRCAMVLEEKPAKVSEALRYFLEGLGYALNQFRRKSNAGNPTPCVQLKYLPHVPAL